MTCELGRTDVSNIVCGVIAAREGGIVTEFTRFEEDLGVDEARKRSYFAPVRGQIEANGCELTRTTPNDFGRATTVGDDVNAVWNDIKAQIAPQHNEALISFAASFSKEGAELNTESSDYLRGYRDGVVDAINKVIAIDLP